MNDIQNSNKGEIVMYQPDETIRLEVKLEDDTVWLTQQQMSLLFSVKENTITYHIKEIYRTEELEQEGTARKIRVVRKEGNRIVNRMIDFYNLDMIISVGYKVNSANEMQESLQPSIPTNSHNNSSWMFCATTNSTHLSI